SGGGMACAGVAAIRKRPRDCEAESPSPWTNAGVKPQGPQAFRHVAGWYFAAPYGVYATKDGHMAISLTGLGALAEALDEPRLAIYSDRETWTKQDEIGAVIGARLATADTAHWVARMKPRKIWHPPV